MKFFFAFLKYIVFSVAFGGEMGYNAGKEGVKPAKYSKGVLQ